jgi:hypothetical protein
VSDCNICHNGKTLSVGWKCDVCGRVNRSKSASSAGSARSKVKPLNPPATEAELNNASRYWTEAQDVMVQRGFCRHLWGNERACCHEFVVLMLRAALKGQLNQPGTP